MCKYGSSVILSLWNEIYGTNLNLNDVHDRTLLCNMVYLTGELSGYFDFPFHESASGMYSYEVIDRAENEQKAPFKQSVFIDPVNDAIRRVKFLKRIRIAVSSDENWIAALAISYHYIKYVCKTTNDTATIFEKIMQRKRTIPEINFPFAIIVMHDRINAF